MDDWCTVNSVPVANNNFVSVAVSYWFAVANPPLTLGWSSVTPVVAVVVKDVLHGMLPSVTQVDFRCLMFAA